MQVANKAKGVFDTVKDSVKNFTKVLVAGAAGAALVLKNAKDTIIDKASGNVHVPSKKHKIEEDGKMKKSTVVAILVALSVVAGILGAIYVYLLRRERELDEYEQLLFSEDFTDDFDDFDTGIEPLADDAEPAGAE